MAIRVRHRVYVQTSRDTAGKSKLFYPDPELEESVTDGLDNQAGGSLTMAADEVVNLAFGDVVACKGLYLEVSGTTQVVLNGGDPLELTPVAGIGTTTRAKLFIEAPLTEVQLTNLADETVTGVYCLWGDPTP